MIASDQEHWRLKFAETLQYVVPLRGGAFTVIDISIDKVSDADDKIRRKCVYLDYSTVQDAVSFTSGIVGNDGEPIILAETLRQSPYPGNVLVVREFAMNLS